jgi:hypothetical protein
MRNKDDSGTKESTGRSEAVKRAAGKKMSYVGRMRMAEVRNLAPTPPAIYKIWGATHQELRVRRQLMRLASRVADKWAPPHKNGHAQAHARYDYGVVTQGTRRPVPSPSHVTHDARTAPPVKARPLHTTRDHERELLMTGFLLR